MADSIGSIGRKIDRIIDKYFKPDTGLDETVKNMPDASSYRPRDEVRLSRYAPAEPATIDFPEIK